MTTAGGRRAGGRRTAAAADAGGLDAATEALVRISAALGAGDAPARDAALEASSSAADAEAVEEALIQSYLFLGYPAALNAMAAWRVLTGRPAPARAPDDWAAWRDRGEAICARVYGGQYERLRENVARLHPDLERWMVTEGYGKVLARPGLPLKTRELCIVALLAGQDVPRQLYSHLRGAVNAGASPGEVDAALELARSILPTERAEAALRIWTEVRARVRPGGTGTGTSTRTRTPGREGGGG